MENKNVIKNSLYIFSVFLVALFSLYFLKNNENSFYYKNQQDLYSVDLKTVVDIYDKKDKKLIGTISSLEELEKYYDKILTYKFGEKNLKNIYVEIPNNLIFNERKMNPIEYEEFKKGVSPLSGNNSVFERIFKRSELKIPAIEVKVGIGENTKTFNVISIEMWTNTTNEFLSIKKNEELKLFNKNTSFSIDSNVEFNRKNILIEDILTEEQLRINITGTSVFEDENSNDLTQIASSFQTTVEKILFLNKTLNENSIILPNMKILIPEEKNGIPLFAISYLDRIERFPFSIEYTYDDSLYEGEEEIIQEGIEGERLVNVGIKLNSSGEEVLLSKIEKETLSYPTNKIISIGTKYADFRGTGTFIWPSNSQRVAAEFMDPTYGGDHYGIDINDGLNRDVLAADNGTVIVAEFNSSYGNYIIINHNNGLWTLYAHLNTIEARVGQTAVKGKRIGGMGTTGISTGVHLHFEIRDGANSRDNSVNPRKYF